MRTIKLTSSLWGTLAPVALMFTLAFTSCDKDEANNAIERTICIETNGASVYYTINNEEGITYTTKGIVRVKNHDLEHPMWILGYQEIASRLHIPFEQVSTMSISREGILSDGLWRFAIHFESQEEGSEYSIDVNPGTGKIEWTQTIVEMPNGEITLHLI